MLRGLKAFDIKLHYTDRHRLPEAVEKELDVTFHQDVASMVSACDVVTDQRSAASGDGRSLHGTLIAKMKRGASLATNIRSR